MKRGDFLKSLGAILVAPSVLVSAAKTGVALPKKHVHFFNEARLGASVMVNGVDCIITSVFLGGTFTATPKSITKDAGAGAGMSIKFIHKNI